MNIAAPIFRDDFHFIRGRLSGHVNPDEALMGAALLAEGQGKRSSVKLQPDWVRGHGSGHPYQACLALLHHFGERFGLEMIPGRHGLPRQQHENMH